MIKRLTEHLRRHWPTLLLIAAVAAFIGLANLTGCAASAERPATASAQLTDEQALFAAEAALVGAAEIAVTAKRAGVLSEEARLALADQLETGWRVMLSARCIHAVVAGLEIREDVVSRCQAAVAEHGLKYRPLAFRVLAIAGAARAAAQGAPTNG